MVMQCLLVCEGSSDTPLVSHIQRMLDGHGYHAADFHISTDGRRLVEKVSNGLEMRSRYDLVFVHRDADRAGADARYLGNHRGGPDSRIQRPVGRHSAGANDRILAASGRGRDS